MQHAIAHGLIRGYNIHAWQARCTMAYTLRAQPTQESTMEEARS